MLQVSLRHGYGMYAVDYGMEVTVTDKKIERVGGRSPTRVRVEAMVRDNAPDSRVILTLEREGAGLSVGEPVLMTVNLAEEAVLALIENLERAYDACWPEPDSAFPDRSGPRESGLMP